MTEMHSERIKNMGALCVCLVVSIHSGVTGGPVLSSSWFVRQLIVEGIAPIAVPFFFVASGFFLARHFGEVGWWRRETTKRIKTLIVPYLVWSLMATLLSLPLSIITDVMAQRPLGTSVYFIHGANWLTVFGLNLKDYPLNYPLWYIRCLIVLVVLSFPLDLLLSRFKYIWLIVLFLLHIFVGYIPLNGWSASLGRFTCGLFYFSLGMALRKYESSFVLPRCATVVCGVLGLTICAAKMFMIYHGGGVAGISCVGKVATLFLLYFTWMIVSCSAWPVWLTSNVFPIYCMHAIITGYIRCLGVLLGLGAMMVSAVRFAGSIIFSCVIAYLLLRCSHELHSLAFGGRR